MMKDSKSEGLFKMENELDALARELTSRFLQSRQFRRECSYEEAFLIYKILHSQEQFLRCRYFSGNNAASIYRQIARLLHPDKNKHPLAKEAFFKVSSIFNHNV